MAKMFKVLVTTELTVEKLVLADSREEVLERMDEIVKRINPYEDDDPQIETDVYEREDYDDEEADFDLTKGPEAEESCENCIWFQQVNETDGLCEKRYSSVHHGSWCKRYETCCGKK